ncbi:MAG TPA: FlgD immunoglobulin-like domain containing protein [Gaiellaceae bacterium]
MRRHAATIVVLALLIGTAVAFAETERLKLEATPIEESFVQPAFSPACGCATSKAAIRVRLHRADTVTVRILNAQGETIAVPVAGQHLPSGRSTLEWDGRDSSGATAPDGFYHVEVRLARAGRTFRLPRQIALDTVPPRARLVSYKARLRPGQRVRVVYRVSEPAHGVLFVNGKRVAVTYTKSRRARLQWQPKGPGRYRLQLAGLDLAGNLGPRTPVFVVRVTSV